MRSTLIALSLISLLVTPAFTVFLKQTQTNLNQMPPHGKPVPLPTPDFHFLVKFNDGRVQGFNYGELVHHPQDESAYFVDIQFTDKNIQNWLDVIFLAKSDTDHIKIELRNPDGEYVPDFHYQHSAPYQAIETFGLFYGLDDRVILRITNVNGSGEPCPAFNGDMPDENGHLWEGERGTECHDPSGFRSFTITKQKNPRVKSYDD